MAARIRVRLARYGDRTNILLQWTDPLTGRRRSKSAGTADPAAAEAARADLEYELSHGLADDHGRTAWETFLRLYESEHLMGCSDKHHEKAMQVLRRYHATMNPRTLADITERRLSDFARRLRERGFRATTIRGQLTYLRAGLRWAASQRLLRDPPTVTMPKIPRNANRAKIQKAARITTEEYERLLMVSPNDGCRLFVAFCWHCGLRREEARAVAGRDVDLQRHVIAIGKNKAADEAATVVIPPDLDAMLRAMFPDGFPRGRLISADHLATSLPAVSRRFAKIAAAAQVPGNGRNGFCTPHDLRRSFGSRWAGKVPAQVLQRLMRHANIRTTLDYYADTEAAALAAFWGNE